MSTLLLDTHVVHWWTTEPERLSRTAEKAVEEADDLVMSGISFFELAWLARRGRIGVAKPIGLWLQELAAGFRTMPITAAIAVTAATLPDSFPRDPADRLIYATAIEHGWRLVTKDERLRSHRHDRPITVW
ncbi:MAG TPA: PIN domain-containing protein [Chloroflexota bacterium]|nr:PIN domain-containing protein [Chloroflexota bacterium]